ncbi:rab-GTPase-TBC domain-containing protein [Cladochytrium replicatum]|nr:rab-GTPase-TBC domain-containing protein [Cladochytrium replicatum]
MSMSNEEFREIINAEVHIDMDKLRQAARHGIPEEVRGEVWKYLLEVQTPDRSNELTSARAKYEEYLLFDKENSDVAKRVRNEAQRYQRARPPPPSSTSKWVSPSSTSSSSRNSGGANALVVKSGVKNVGGLLENVLCAYVNHHSNTDYFPSMVNLCGPFVYTLVHESDIYFCFERLMSALEEHFAMRDLNERLSHFLMLFRTLMPDLYNHFEEEEVDWREWASSWCSYLLSRELPLECVMRLWDTYFSIADGLELHVYVCLAILSNRKDELEELEQSQIHALLLRLPRFDMDQLISHAVNIRHDVIERSLALEEMSL